LDDDITSLVEEADAYCLEGPLTTFFRTRGGRPVIDSWSERLASYRTTEVKSVQRLTTGRADEHLVPECVVPSVIPS
jgi:hypothetical protein